MYRWLVIIGFLLFCLEIKPNDSIRIVSYPRHLHLFAKINSSFSQIEIQNPDIKNSLQFQPNAGGNIKLGFYYSWLGFAYSFILPSNKLTNEKFGKTKGFSLDGHLMKTRFMLDVDYKRYTGYYLLNPGKFVSNWDKNKPFPQSPDLSTSVLSASFAYVFRPDRFSPKAAYAHTRAMRVSGGSWMLGGFASISKINSDSSIVSSEIMQFVDPKLELKEVTFSDLGVSFGYSYLLTILKKNFISLSLQPGISYQKIAKKSSITNALENINTISVRTSIHFSMGHNGDKYYYGISGYLESSLINNLNNQLSFSSG